MAADAISATAVGINEMRDGLPVLTQIQVHYTLRLPPGAPRDKVDRALAGHVSKCPTARSLQGAVEVVWSADVAEAPE
jgi:organic hydroperoxide reductase OsmC/OhrA